MTSKVLSDTLTRHGKATREGQTVRLGQDCEVTVYATIGQETLAIDRVTEIELEQEVAIVLTRRHERYVLAYEDVRALRVATDKGPKAAFTS